MNVGSYIDYDQILIQINKVRRSRGSYFVHDVELSRRKEKDVWGTVPELSQGKGVSGGESYEKDRNK